MALARVQTVGPWEAIGSYDPGPPYFATGSTTYTCGSFNASANSILVVGVAVGGAANCTVSTITNTGTALTWTRLIRRTPTTINGLVNQELWYALNTSAQTGITYSLAWTENTDNYTGYGRGILVEYTGHDTTTPFADSDSYSGTLDESKPVSATAVTQVTGGVVVGVFTDNLDTGTLSSSNADAEAAGLVNSNSIHNTAYFTRGIRDSLSAGSFSPSMNTDEASGWWFGGVFGVLQPSSAPAATKRGPGIGRY